MKQEPRKRFLKRARTLKTSKTIRESIYSEEDIMSKNKLNKFRAIRSQDNKDNK